MNKTRKLSLEALEDRAVPSAGWAISGNVATWTDDAGGHTVAAVMQGTTFTGTTDGGAAVSASGVTEVDVNCVARDSINAFNEAAVTGAQKWVFDLGDHSHLNAYFVGAGGTSVNGGSESVSVAEGLRSSDQFQVGSVVGGGSLNYNSTHADSASSVFQLTGFVGAGSNVNAIMSETYAHADSDFSQFSRCYVSVDATVNGAVTANVTGTCAGGFADYLGVLLTNEGGAGSMTGSITFGAGATTFHTSNVTLIPC